MKMRWEGQKWSENGVKVRWKDEKVKVIRYDDLIKNVAVDAIICHNYITDITYIHDLWYNCNK